VPGILLLTCYKLHDLTVELLCLVRGKVTVRFGQKTHVIAPGELFLFNSYEIHESWCSRDAAYLCVHILPARMCKYVSNFDQLRFSLHFDPSDSEKALAYFQKYQALRKEAARAYQEKYGPLTWMDQDSDSHWQWVDCPWPWEAEV